MINTKSEVRELVRSIRFARGIPELIRILYTSARQANREFHQRIAPIVSHSVPTDRRGLVLNALLPPASQFAYLALSYSTMINYPPKTGMAVLAGSFGRVYDDVMDEAPEKWRVERLENLFTQGKLSGPGPSELFLEETLKTLLTELEDDHRLELLGRLHEMHRAQVLSRMQADSATDNEQICELTEQKASATALAFFWMIHPECTELEADLMVKVGSILQAGDDYLDADSDIQNGIRTPLSTGLASLTDILGRIRVLAPRLLAVYGSEAHQFVSLLYVQIAVAFVQRRFPAFWQALYPWRKTSRLRYILARNDDTLGMMQQNAFRW